jgi:hypothetical protein
MSVFLAAFFGSIVGQVIVFWTIGLLAEAQQKQQAEATRQALNEYNHAVLKEHERMAKYAKLEG